MANFVFNCSRGMARYYYDAVDNSLVQATGPAKYQSTANAVLVVVGIDAAGQSDDLLADHDDLAALLASTPNEVTPTNYARKILDDTALAASAQDDTNNRLDLDIPDQTWANLISAGTNPNFTDVLVCFDPDSTAGTDSTIIPISCHDFVVTTDGSDVTAQIAAAGFYRSA